MRTPAAAPGRTQRLRDPAGPRWASFVHDIALVDVATVLVVDDDVALARNIAALLSPLGVRASIATSVEEALDLARRSSFDVAIVDIMLPDGDGLALAPLICEHAPDSEIVFVTGQATLDHAALAVGHRASALLIKPFAPNRLVSTVRNALDRKRSAARVLESRLREHQRRALSRLGDGLAHELRNPLNGALLQLEVVTRQLLRDDHDTSLAVLGRLADARSELRRLARTLTEFECCVRPSSTSIERVAAGALVERALAGLTRVAARQGVAIVCELEADLDLEVDPDGMARALGKLAENAIEAMPSGGTLTIAIRTAGDRVIIELEDDGVGIADVTAVFDPFFSTKPMGTGLGLNVAERVVADHRGTIAVRSRPGSTRFTITLPAETSLT